MRGKIRLGLVALIIVVPLVVPELAKAVTCYGNSEQQTFIRHGGISTAFNSEGEIGINYIRDNPLGTCYQQFLERHSTIHIRASNGGYVELGWRKIGNNGYWVGFAEGGVVGDPNPSYREFGFDCALNGTFYPGHWARFKMYFASGTSHQWNFYYNDNNDGTSYCFAGKFTSLTFAQGINTGETGFFGGSDTNTYDHFYGMKYSAQPDNQGWTSWQTNMVWYGCPLPPNWGRQWLANDSWAINQGYPC